MKDIRNITLALPATEFHVYSDGLINVRIQARKGAVVKEGRFTCFIYSADYFPMCNSDESVLFTRHASNDVTIEMPSVHVWLPGDYICLVQDKSDVSLLRIDFSIDESLTLTQQQPVACAPSCLDDVLTCCIENLDSNWDTIATTPGTAQLRKYVMQCRQLFLYNEFRKQMQGKEVKCDRNLLIYIQNKDWDEQVMQAFQKLSVPGHYLTYLDCGTLYNAALQNPYELMNEKFNNTASQVYCLTNVSTLLNTGGRVVVKRIVEKMHEDGGGKYKLWLCGTRLEIDSLLEVNPSLKEFFLRHNRLEQLPYSGFELVQSFFACLDKENLELSAQAKDALSRAVLVRQQQGCFTSWTLATIRRFVAEEIRQHYLTRAIGETEGSNEILPLVTLEDLALDQLPSSASEYEDCLRELNTMVGLDDIKQSIVTMANQTRFFTQRRKAGFPTSNMSAHHAIFTGNPGTGKTTVAKMLGKIYHAIGILSKGDVICVDRTRLVGRYIGETEENMKSVLEEARGNVLFIDEAYNLSEGTTDRKDYGYKVIDSLLTVLALPNPDIVIVFAGYEKEMDAMLTTNPGLMGRFPYKYHFSDYSAEQLMEIACHLFERDAYLLSSDARAVLQEKITDMLSQRTKNFGNARWVEQFIRNGIIPAMADRIMHASSCQDYQQVLPSDVEAGYRQFNPRMVELRPRRQVGFNA